MKTFRLQLRFLIPLVITLVAAAYLAVPVMDRLTLRWFARDLNLRGVFVANTLADSLAEALEDRRGARLQSLIDRVARDERMVGIGLCSPDGELLYRTPGYPKSLACE
ncbi:MAG: trehalose-6-phosphate synthase, partial [Burkholderiales bacterium]|nr:trehalose-6-phosphate synthase [Burkholderiales bacterium]